MKPGVQAVGHFQRKVKSRGENVFLLCNMDLRIGVTASTRTPATHSSLSHGLPICFLLSSALQTS